MHATHLLSSTIAPFPPHLAFLEVPAEPVRVASTVTWVLEGPAPAARDVAIRAPSTKKPAWLTALDAWLDPRVDALARWLSRRR